MLFARIEKAQFPAQLKWHEFFVCFGVSFNAELKKTLLALVDYMIWTLFVIFLYIHSKERYSRSGLGKSVTFYAKSNYTQDLYQILNS